MNQNNISKYDDFDNVEEKLKNDAKSKSKKHKVSGKSVFKLEKIIKDRTHHEKP